MTNEPAPPLRMGVRGPYRLVVAIAAAPLEGLRARVILTLECGHQVVRYERSARARCLSCAADASQRVCSECGLGVDNPAAKHTEWWRNQPKKYHPLRINGVEVES